MSGQKPFPPEAYLIGAQKAGTTSLAFLLQQHPKICLSNPKETHYFSYNFELGLEWYRSHFHGADAQNSSRWFHKLYDGQFRSRGQLVDVAGRIFSQRKDAKFIYILRDPIERTISAYWHNVRFGSERRPFRDAIVDNPAYVWTGQYHKQLQRFLEHFDRSAFLILDFRDLERDPGAVARKAVRFLGLRGAQPPFDLQEPKNRGFQLTSLGRMAGRAFGSDAAFFRSTRLVRKLTPTPVYKLARRMVITDLERIPTGDREWLRDIFREDVEEIQKLAGIFLFD